MNNSFKTLHKNISSTHFIFCKTHQSLARNQKLFPESRKYPIVTWHFTESVQIGNTQKKHTVLNRSHVSDSYLTHSFILRKEEAPVCVACNAVITVKHILIECADLLEIRKKYFEDRSLYSLFWNVVLKFFFLILCERLVCFTKYEVC